MNGGAVIRRIARYTFFGIAVLAVIALLIISRSKLMDAGMMALKTGDGNTAVYYLKPLAFLGERTAQRLLGDIYALGQTEIDKNDAEAIYWFGRCGVRLPTVLGDGENPAAPHEVEVAKQYATGGWGVQADPVECAKWLKLAAEGGNKEAQALLAQSFCQ